VCKLPDRQIVAVISSNLNRFSKFFHSVKNVKFPILPMYYFQPHFKHIAAIPCWGAVLLHTWHTTLYNVSSRQHLLSYGRICGHRKASTSIRSTARHEASSSRQSIVRACMTLTNWSSLLHVWHGMDQSQITMQMVIW